MVAVGEAASIDVLCVDKTGTLTLNQLSVAAIRPLFGFDESRVLGLGALASSDSGQDPVDAGAAVFAFVVDFVKVPFYSRLKIS